ncbi:disease resistance protein RPM1 [Zea mays]|uniref:Disease resistance protein RPM1 n=1 Tax=Zea mays TaxID=4577 RepID=K7TNW0_MAIZE|nr:disease resistance protein RPM1 [Zea mays]XP_008662635.1 disease resistance protein RPM1 [Zea mays]XP_020401447.1 disease resistance protein RPM1 [Zea mays]AQK40401.1 Disease resistance protein RPM1 [Zea mays]|eukprot:XP_008662634.1 disease resistance protein RPM1 [Zea mays]
MAEGLILVVLQKIATTLGGAALSVIKSKLGKGANILLEAENSMKEIESEFEIMQAYISQADPYSESNKILKPWLKNVRKIASEVEDIIDEYAFLLGKLDNAGYLAKKFHHSRYITAWSDISSQLKQVQARLQNLTVLKDRYGITVVGPGGGSSSHNNSRKNYLSESSYLNDDGDGVMVGNEDEVKKLTECIDGAGADRAVISIWGMGGSGKTILARGIYRKREVRKNFQCCAWITVSLNYQVEDLLNKLIKELHIQDVPDATDSTHLVARIQNHLKDKRYLVVLDDMWNRESWLFFDRVFVKNLYGSRVIVTTRTEAVASIAELNHTIRIGLLSQGESWKLFGRKAFSKIGKEEPTCPQGLVQWANKILERCQGLPLAIVAIGSLLSYREMEEQEWRLFYNQLNWQLTNNPELNFVSSVLKLSLNDLPSHLRNCFLYCGLFPKDYQIRRKCLIRLWVAEGFVEDRGTEITLEEVAEEYLKELTRRSLFQVMERNEFSRPRRFQVHDLVREMTLAISRNERFGHVSDQPDVTDIGDVGKRVSVHSGGQIYQPGPSSQHLRSFLLFDKHVPLSWISIASSDFKLLRVLCLRYSLLEDIPDAMTCLFNLHHLDCSRTKVRKVPRSVARLKKLETLHLRFARVRELPSEITMLTNLRHLSVSDDLYGTSICGTIRSLKHLQTLREVKVNKDLAKSLGYLTQLRSLGITGVIQSHNADLWASIRKMTVLNKLAVATPGESNEVLSFEELRPLKNLEKFYLTGKLAEGKLFPVSNGFQKLKVLTMRWSKLTHDPLSSLCQMENLVYLNLYCAYDGECLIFSSGWFPKLKQLYLGKLERLRSIQISDGAIENLTYLELHELWNLKSVPEGLVYLRSLQHLYARKMPADFVEELEGSCQGFVRHIANIECM